MALKKSLKSITFHLSPKKNEVAFENKTEKVHIFPPVCPD